MNWDRHTLWNAGWPALSVGAVGVALSAIVPPGLLIPSCVAVSAVAGNFLTAAWVHRGQQEAKARLPLGGIASVDRCLRIVPGDDDRGWDRGVTR